MSDSVSKVNKPQLRGLLHSQIKKSIVLACGLCVIAAVAQKIFVNDHRQNVYAEFYKHYDINKEFNKIRNKGLFESCEPDH